MKNYLIKQDSSVYRGELTIVKANSAKEAVNKFLNYRLNSKEMYEEFEEGVSSYLEGDYFDWMCKDGIGEYDWDSVTENFLRSKKAFGDKRRFKGLDLEKVVRECMSDNLSLSKASDETKKAIFNWMHGLVEALDLSKFKIIE